MKNLLCKCNGKKRFRNLLLVFFVSSLLILPANAQTIKISGIITSTEDGQGIPGAYVLNKNSGKAVIADVNGGYSIDAVSGDVLEFSFLGKMKQTVTITTQTKVDISLNDDVVGLEEIVVVGYGTVKKSDLISSVSSVKAEKMTKVAVADVGEMLRGKAAGVQVTLNDAGPGGSSNIQVRGRSSIVKDDKGNLININKPIIIADGVQISALNEISPSDIASVEILKDAAAQAIYGARAANGVILITTKRGKSGEVTVNYNGYYGSQWVKKNFEVFSPEEFIQLKMEAFRTTSNDQYPDTIEPGAFSAVELESKRTKKYIDWEKIVMRNAPIQNHDLSISGGTEKTMVYLGLNYQKQEGVVPSTDFEKGQMRLNVDQTLSKWVKIGLNTSFAISKGNNPDVSGVLRETVRSSPLGKVYNEDGTLKVHPTDFQENFNPLNDLKEVSLVKSSNNNLINIFMDISPITGLNYRINASRRSGAIREDKYSTINSNSGNANKYGGGSIKTLDSVSWTVDNILSYTTEIDQSHITATLIQSVSEDKEHKFGNDFPKVPNDILGVYGMESAAFWKPTIGGYKRNLVSYAGRLQYDYASKYYITVSGRRDGSSVFGADNKWGFFPSVALGWNIMNESFLADIKTLTNLKLRMSYGSVGNEAIVPYQSLVSADKYDYYTTTLYSGYSPGNTLPNPKLKWETSTTLNGALDFGVLKGRLTGTIELYKTNTTDLLVKKSIDASTGYSYMYDNIGEIQNTGVELQLDGIVIKTKDLTVQAGIMFSKNKNEIVKLFGDINNDGKEDDDVANKWFIGEPIDVDYDYEALGIWQISEKDSIPTSAQPKAKPGYVKVDDKDGDKKLTNADKVVKSKMPSWSGSFSFGVSFIGIDFSLDINTVQGITKYNKYLAEYAYGGDLRGVFNGVKVDYWTPENPNAAFPRPNNGTTPEFNGLVAREDASYWRLQNMSLGYTVPANLTAKVKLGKVRFYCTGHNLYTSTKFQSFSPEKDADAYPEAISIVGGVQIGF